jgi:hypothetical protein
MTTSEQSLFYVVLLKVWLGMFVPVVLGALAVSVARREEISAMITSITGAQEAGKGQLDVLECPVDWKSDTILVAATSYGKSVVLYAFAALTKKLTIQIAPLTKLG